MPLTKHAVFALVASAIVLCVSATGGPGSRAPPTTPRNSGEGQSKGIPSLKPRIFLQEDLENDPSGNQAEFTDLLKSFPSPRSENVPPKPTSTPTSTPTTGSPHDSISPRSSRESLTSDVSARESSPRRMYGYLSGANTPQRRSAGSSQSSTTPSRQGSVFKISRPRKDKAASASPSSGDSPPESKTALSSADQPSSEPTPVENPSSTPRALSDNVTAATTPAMTSPETSKSMMSSGSYGSGSASQPKLYDLLNVGPPPTVSAPTIPSAWNFGALYRMWLVSHEKRRALALQKRKYLNNLAQSRKSSKRANRSTKFDFASVTSEGLKNERKRYDSESQDSSKRTSVDDESHSDEEPVSLQPSNENRDVQKSPLPTPTPDLGNGLAASLVVTTPVVLQSPPPPSYPPPPPPKPGQSIDLSDASSRNAVHRALQIFQQLQSHSVWPSNASTLVEELKVLFEAQSKRDLHKYLKRSFSWLRSLLDPTPLNEKRLSARVAQAQFWTCVMINGTKDLAMRATAVSSADDLKYRALMLGQCQLPKDMNSIKLSIPTSEDARALAFLVTLSFDLLHSWMLKSDFAELDPERCIKLADDAELGGLTVGSNPFIKPFIGKTQDHISGFASSLREIDSGKGVPTHQERVGITQVVGSLLDVLKRRFPAFPFYNHEESNAKRESFKKSVAKRLRKPDPTTEQQGTVTTTLLDRQPGPATATTKPQGMVTTTLFDRQPGPATAIPGQRTTAIPTTTPPSNNQSGQGLTTTTTSTYLTANNGQPPKRSTA